MVTTTTKPAKIENPKALVVVRNIRFTREQWKFLEATEEITGCPIGEFVRRLVDAERNRKDGQK